MIIVAPLGSIEELKVVDPILQELRKKSDFIKIAIGSKEDCDDLERVTDIYSRIEVQKAESGVQESKSWGIELFCLTQEIEEINAHCIVVLGTGRHMFSAAVVGAHLNILVFRIDSGSAELPIEKMFRDSSIKFAHMHIVKDELQKERLLKLGEERNRIIITSDPKDIAKRILTEKARIQKILAY